MKKLFLLSVYILLAKGHVFSSEVSFRFAEIAQTADIIFVGTVESLKFHGSETESMISTNVKFGEIDLIFASERSQQKGSEKITLTYLGGTIGAREMLVSDAPIFEENQRYLVFSFDDGRKYINPLIGGNQGLFRVTQDVITEQEYVLSANNRALVELDELELGFSTSEVAEIRSREIVLKKKVESIRSEPAALLLANSPENAVAKTKTSRERNVPLLVSKFIQFIRESALSYSLGRKFIQLDRQGRFFFKTARGIESVELPRISLSNKSFHTIESALTSNSMEKSGTELGTCSGITPPIVIQQVPSDWWSWPIHEEAMDTWNSFMPIFQSTPYDGQVGQNWTNEFLGWQSSANLSSMYQDVLGSFSWSTSTYVRVASTFTIQEPGGECTKTLEADIAYNPNYDWTNDLLVALDYQRIILLQPYVMHELGHVWGYQNGGLYPETRDYDRITVMHYFNFDVVEDGKGIHHPDAYLIRQHYHNNFSVPIPSIVDVGVESYHTSNGHIRNAWIDRQTYQQGEKVTLHGITVENMSNSAVTDLRLQFYLSQDRQITTSDLPLGDYFYADNFPAEAYNTGDYIVEIPENIPPDIYYIGAHITVNGLGLDDFESNNQTFINTPIVVTSRPLTSSLEVEESLEAFSFYPNPFQTRTTIFFDLAHRSRTKLLIFNTSGILVSSLLNTSLPPGRHSILWDGKDNQKKKVPPGTYICTLMTDSIINSKKLILMH